MRSGARCLALVWLIGAIPAVAPLAEGVGSAPVQAAPAKAETANAGPSQAALDAALAELRRDPNLGGKRQERTLRWTTKPSSAPDSPAPAWLVTLVETIGQFGGLMLWVAGAGAAAMAAVWLFRVWKARHPRAVPAPSHVAARRVLDLDIDPEMLPADVGAAALALLRAGRLRDGLSLLYRASLSAGVHRFGASIGAQHTEREVVSVMRGVLDEPRARYVEDLVAIRQRVVYAGEPVAEEVVHPLCARFSACFDPPTP